MKNIIILLIIFFFILPNIILGSTYEELYEKAFKKKLVKTQEFYNASYLLDNYYKNKIKVIIEPDGTLKFETTPLITQLKEILLETEINQIFTAFANKEYINSTSLTNLGFTINFNKFSNLLTINTPAKYKKDTIISWSLNKNNLKEFNLYKPANFAGYLNIKSEATYKKLNRAKTMQLYPAFYLDGNIFYENFNLNVYGDYFQKELTDEKQFNLKEVSLSQFNGKDLQENTLGIISNEIHGFQTSRTLIGLKIKNSLYFNPNLQTSPKKQIRLELKEKSLIELILNKEKIFSKEILEGGYIFKDFPLKNGPNNIEILIKNSTGEKKESYTFIKYDSLLDPSYSDAIFEIGLPFSLLDQQYYLYKNYPTLSYYYRTGFNEFTTIGPYFQSDLHQAILGCDTLFTFSDYILNLTYGASIAKTKYLDHSLEATLSSYSDYSTSDGLKWWYASLGYKGINFDKIYSVPNQTDKELIDIGAYAQIYINYQISSDLSLGLNSFVNFIREDKGNNFGLNFSFMHKFSENYQANYIFGYRYFPETLSENSENEDAASFSTTKITAWIFRVSITWIPSKTPHKIKIEQKGDLGKTALNWRYLPQNPHMLNMNADVEQGANESLASTSLNWDRINSKVEIMKSLYEQSKTASLEYNGNRGKVRFSVQEYEVLAQEYQSGLPINYSTTMGLDTAFVWAGPNFAISTPVKNNFAILYPHNAIKNLNIDILSGESIDIFGPAVISNLADFQVATIQLNPKNVPIGVDLGPSIFSLKPARGQAYAIQIGTGATVILKGQLVGHAGKALKFISADLYYLQENTPPRPLFTNLSGKFIIDKIEPGDYKLVIRDLLIEEIYFTIPVMTGYYSIGKKQSKYKAESVNPVLIKPDISKEDNFIINNKDLPKLEVFNKFLIHYY